MDKDLIMPKVSVIMSVYNGGKFLKPAIESILRQSFSDFEFIIINDGSADDSLEAIKSFTDERIKLISRENRGLIVSLNEAIENSSGQYLARMDADDVSLPDRLARQVDFLDSHQDTAMCGTWAQVIDEAGKAIDKYHYPPESYAGIKKMLLSHNPFIHPTVMIRKSVIDKVGSYKLGYKHAEDYELWTRIVPKYPCANLPAELFRYRINTAGITRSSNATMRLLGLKVRLLAGWRLMIK